MTDPRRRSPAASKDARRRARRAAALAAAAMLATGAWSDLRAGPQRGAVVRGDGSISTAGGVTTIRQGSRKLVIDWRSFDIEAEEAVRFLQPGKRAIALNRVLDDLPTHIRGKLEANGQVWLVNPSGVFIHKGAAVNVGGLIATTADIDDDAFMAGDHRFDRPGEPGAKIVNEGTITFGEAGLAGIVAPQVENRGVIAGERGRIVIAGQESFSVDVSGDGLFEIDLADAAPAPGARVVNEGLLSAPGGVVVISAAAARDAVEAAVNVGGVVEARSATRDGGTIVLSGGAGDVAVSARLNADGASGGAVRATGRAVSLAPGARVSASGAGGGGTVRIEATRIEAAAGARISADATLKGDGGEILLLGADALRFSGAVSARGGPEGGAGGFAELSAQRLAFDGTADLGAPQGATGRLLFDPDTIVIGAAGDDDGRLPGGIDAGEGPGETFFISADALSAVDAETTLQATRLIRVDAAVNNPDRDAGLALESGGDIRIAADVIFAGALRFSAGATLGGTPGQASGSILFDGDATLAGGRGLTLEIGPDGLVGQGSLGDLSVSLRSGRGLTLPRTSVSGALGIETNGAVTQTGPVSVFGTLAIGTSGADATLDDDGNILTGPILIEAGDVKLRTTGAMQLGSASIRALEVFAADGVLATGPVIAAEDVTLASAGGPLSLAHPENLFGDRVTALTGLFGGAPADVMLETAGELVLGRVQADRLIAVAGTGIRGSGESVTTLGPSFLDAGAGDIALGSPGRHDFGGPTYVLGRDIALADVNALSIAGESAGDVTLTAAGIKVFDALRVGGGAGALAISTPGDAALGAGPGLTLDAGELRWISAGETRILADGVLRSSGALDLTSLGDATLESAGMTLAGDLAFGGALTLRASGGIDADAAALRVPGAFVAAAGLDASLFNAGNRFDGPVEIEGKDVAVRASESLAVRDSAARGSARFAAENGLTLEDSRIGEDLAAASGGPMVAARTEVGGVARLESPNGVAAADLLAGALVVESGAGLTLDRAKVRDALSLKANGRLEVSRTEAGGLVRLESGAAIAAVNLRAGGLEADAGGRLSLDAARARADAALLSRRASILLGSFAVGGRLEAVALNGGIRTGSGSSVLEGYSVDTPNGGEVAAVDAGGLLQVGGSAWFDAAGDLLLVRDRGGAGANRLSGKVTVSRAARVAIETAGDLRIGAGPADLPGGVSADAPGISDRLDGAIAGGVHLRARGDIRDVRGAGIRAAGDARFVAGGDVVLDEGGHRIGGAVAARGDAVTLSERGGLRLGPISAGGDFTAKAGALGGDGAAWIAQADEVSVPGFGMKGGVADGASRTFAGALTVAGAADFSSGLSGDAPLDSVNPDARRTVRLTDPANVLEGPVSLRRVSGDVRLVEEATSATMETDARDGGKLRLRQLEVGADLSIATTDDVIFEGVLTALRDAEIPDARPGVPAKPGRAGLRRQGRERLPASELRLLLADGATLKVDATADGLDPAGGDIRFDRPVDGINGLLPERTKDSVNARGGAARVTLDAGSRGHVRLRHFFGAASPLGDFEVSEAGNVTLGLTYASREAGPDTPATRFLLAPDVEQDILFAHNMAVEAHGAIRIETPSGLVALYEDQDDYFGINVKSFFYGLEIEPEEVEVFGFIGETGRRAAGLFPQGPRGPNFIFNGCVIGDIQDCTTVSPPDVLDVVRVERAEIVNVEEEDLIELFASYGNEELWGVPPSYFLDVYEDEDELLREEERQTVPAPELEG